MGCPDCSEGEIECDSCHTSFCQVHTYACNLCYEVRICYDCNEYSCQKCFITSRPEKKTICWTCGAHILCYGDYYHYQYSDDKGGWICDVCRAPTCRDCFSIKCGGSYWCQSCDNKFESDMAAGKKFSGC